MNAESETMGYWEYGSDTVHLREDLSSAINHMILKVSLEEIAHYITEATDNSRDFQSFLLDVILGVVA